MLVLFGLQADCGISVVKDEIIIMQFMVISRAAVFVFFNKILFDTISQKILKELLQKTEDTKNI